MQISPGGDIQASTGPKGRGAHWREQHVQRSKSRGGAHVGRIRRKPVWQWGRKARKEDFGVRLKEVWGPNGGPFGLILFGKELPLQSHAPGEA